MISPHSFSHCVCIHTLYLFLLAFLFFLFSFFDSIVILIVSVRAGWTVSDLFMSANAFFRFLPAFPARFLTVFRVLYGVFVSLSSLGNAARRRLPRLVPPSTTIRTARSRTKKGTRRKKMNQLIRTRKTLRRGTGKSEGSVQQPVKVMMEVSRQAQVQECIIKCVSISVPSSTLVYLWFSPVAERRLTINIAIIFLLLLVLLGMHYFFSSAVAVVLTREKKCRIIVRTQRRRFTWSRRRGRGLDSNHENLR